MRLGSLLLLGLLSSAEAAAGEVSIEKTTISWVRLEELLSRQGREAPRSKPPAPKKFSITSAQVSGELDKDQARLDFTLAVSVLSDNWSVIPLFPGSFAVSSARVHPEGNGFLIADEDGVSLVVDTAGAYRVEATVQAALERTSFGGRLRWAPKGLAGGHASLGVPPGRAFSGRTAWRSDGSDRRIGGVLGRNGLDLLVDSAERVPEADSTGKLPELEALTVLSLGGSGTTRLVFRAVPPSSGIFELTLPRGAQVWRVFVGGLEVAKDQAEGVPLRLALRGPALVEVAYTFEAPPLGLRGRYRVELPYLAAPLRGARWEVWMPDGLHYQETQASLATAPTCRNLQRVARTPLEPQGTCLGFARAVLAPGSAYVEGAFEQPM